MIKTHHHREPPTYREIGRSTLARYPGDPLPAWLRPRQPTIRFIRAQALAEMALIDAPDIFGTPTLPDYEERT